MLFSKGSRSCILVFNNTPIVGIGFIPTMCLLIFGFVILCVEKPYNNSYCSSNTLYFYVRELN